MGSCMHLRRRVASLPLLQTWHVGDNEQHDNEQAPLLYIACCGWQ
jgi:hypothetical protein